LHLLFFIFYPRARGNLYYAILAGWTAVLIFVPMYFPFGTQHLEVLLGLVKMSLIGAILASLKFYYYEFFNRMPRYWSTIVWPGYLLCLFSWKIPLQIVFTIAFLGFPELIRIVIKAIRQHKPGAWLIGLGLSAFVMTSAYQLLIEVNVITRTESFLYIYGILCLVVSMSVYLAYTFGAASRQLESQVLQVQSLSEQNIKQSQLAREQERETREREIARKVLEAENQLRTLELEESQKRQQISDDLALSNNDLRQTRAQLVQAEKMASLGNLVAGIAHEINTPVGAINSMHDTLVRAVAKLEIELEQRLPQEHPARRVMAVSFQVIGEANRVIATGTERVRDIVRSLRNFARLDEADWKRVDLHEGIESTLALVQHNLKNRIELVKDYGQIPLVECFPGRLNQVFLNLLVNAAQAIDDRGKITIRTWQDGERVFVAITDTGKGIPPENVSRIFDSGFTTKKVGQGTGLGLSICSQIVQAHQGEILVESKVGEGTVFTVVLPIVQDQKEEMP
jgi:signal transduction histidine kinase